MRGPLVYKLHLLIVLSYDPLNRCLSQIDMATEKTGPWWPISSYVSVSTSSSRSNSICCWTGSVFSYLPASFSFALSGLFFFCYFDGLLYSFLSCSSSFSSGAGSSLFFKFSFICYLIISSTVKTSCCFLDRIKTLMVLSDMPVAMTEPLSERQMQFSCL